MSDQPSVFWKTLPIDRQQRLIRLLGRLACRRLAQNAPPRERGDERGGEERGAGAAMR